MALDLPLEIDRTAGRPLAAQVADALRRAAADGALRPGDRLPSTRALAAGLGVSRTVTAAAYDQLHAEGWTTGRHGAGTFLTTAPAPPAPPPSAAPPDPPAAGLDLHPGTPWTAGIDPSAWRRAWRAAGDEPPDPRPRPAGSPAFRAAVAEHLLRPRGLPVAPDGVLATAGTTAALAELATAVLRPGDAVAVEQPGYPRAVAVLRDAGLRVVPVPVDGDGLVVDRLPDGVRAVYCTPAHQFPLGARLPAARRVRLVQLARERGALVVEDDYDGELRHDAPPLPLLAALAPDVVVHLGTASKVLTPTLGTGWLVAPPAVAAAVLALRTAGSTRPAPAGQRVLTALARTGDLARHLRRVRRELLARRDLVVAALRAAGLPVLGERTGAHLVVPLPGPAAERAAVAAAAAEGLVLDGLARCGTGPSGIALGYAAPRTRAELAAVLPRLVPLLAAAAGWPPV